MLLWAIRQVFRHSSRSRGTAHRARAVDSTSAAGPTGRTAGFRPARLWGSDGLGRTSRPALLLVVVCWVTRPRREMETVGRSRSRLRCCERRERSGVHDDGHREGGPLDQATRSTDRAVAIEAFTEAYLALTPEHKIAEVWELLPYRIAALVGIGFAWEPRQEGHEGCLGRIRAWIQRHNHGRVPNSMLDEPDLGHAAGIGVLCPANVPWRFSRDRPAPGLCRNILVFIGVEWWALVDSNH